MKVDGTPVTLLLAMTSRVIWHPLIHKDSASATFKEKGLPHKFQQCVLSVQTSIAFGKIVLLGNSSPNTV